MLHPAARSGKAKGRVRLRREMRRDFGRLIELLARAVVLVAGMNLAEAERAAVLARVVAELTSQTTRILE